MFFISASSCFLILCALVGIQVLEEIINLRKAGKEILVGSKAAGFDDPVGSLAVPQDSESVCLRNLGGRSGELSHTLDLVAFASLECALAARVVDVPHGGFSLRFCCLYITMIQPVKPLLKNELIDNYVCLKKRVWRP